MGALQALVGHQYGTASLPSRVKVAKYQMLLQVCQQAGITSSALEEAYYFYNNLFYYYYYYYYYYLRDENSIPPSYWLRLPAGRTHGPMESYVSVTPLIE